MSRRSVLLGVLTLLLLAGGVAAAVVLMALHEPGFYRHAAVPKTPERIRLSDAFKTKFFSFLSDFKENKNWQASFTQEEINSFLEEDFVRSRSNTLILPEGITAPRLVLEADRLRLAFRYHIGRWSTVISVDMRVWLAAKVPNVIVLELQGMHAGSLPVSTQSLLDRLTDMADRNNIKVTWYRYKGSPVAVLQFQGEQPTTPVSLERLDLQPGTIQFQGHSEEQPTPVNTSGADPSRSAPP